MSQRRKLRGLIVGLAGSPVVFGLLASLAPATIVPHLDLEALTANADLIVVGRAVSERKLRQTKLGPAEGNLPAWEVVLRLEVERVIKGKLNTADVSFRMLQPVEGVGAEAPRYKGVRLGQFGVFFLESSATGYELLDPYHPFVPAAPGAPAPQGNYIDIIAAELGSVFTSHDVAVRSRWVRWDAVMALETLDTQAATTALKAAAEDPDLLVRVWAISTLLTRNDTSVLERVEKLGPVPADPQVENLTAQLEPALGRITDKRAIPALVRLLRSKDVNIRRGAAAALRNMHDPVAVKPLAGALYDSDQQVRYYAVVGLGEITGQNEWTPSIANFQENEQKFLKHWREWAAENIHEAKPSTPK